MFLAAVDTLYLLFRTFYVLKKVKPLTCFTKKMKKMICIDINLSIDTFYCNNSFNMLDIIILFKFLRGISYLGLEH